MPKRWAPGHYMQCTDGVGRSGIANWKRALVASNPNIVGYQVSIWWGQTESTLGNYANLTTQLNAIRSAAQADGKKVWLRMFERSFHGQSRPRPFPTYVSTNGWDFSSTGGENIWAVRLWESGPKSAFLDWVQAVATYCAANAEFVLLSTEEYSTQGAWQQAGYTEALNNQLQRDIADRALAYAGDCLVHINTGWGNSWPPDYASDKAVLDQLALGTRKVVIGPTDLRKDNNSGSATLATNFGSFMFNSPSDASRPGYRGTAAFCICYEWPDYQSVDSPAEHLRWGVDDLGIHFLAWDPDPDASTGMPWNWSDALAAINAANGRINTARPTNVDGGTAPVTPPDLTLPTLLAFDLVESPAGVLQFTSIGAAANAAPVWNAPVAQTGYVGVAFSYTPTLASGSPASAFSKVSGPAWANVNSGTGQITGTPGSAASVADVVVGANNGVGGTVNVTVPINVLAAPAAFAWVTAATLPNAVLGEPYYQELAYTGTDPSTFAAISGSLPAGLVRVGNIVTGTPTALGGPATFTVEGDNAFGPSASRTFSITVVAASAKPVITPGVLPSLQVGVAGTITITRSGSGTITLRVVGGALPPGMSLSAPTASSNQVTGTPTQPGGYVVTIEADNGIGTPAVAVFVINVAPAGAAIGAPSPWTRFQR